ncbi:MULTISPECIES: hypothetical protein [unclassified Rhodanobacter]|uniref:hypothetical protein n=1 Tax=unclassified Rhodanobacter TaxID=2621553 RepID=UPI000AF27B28|nr:MULTISPECIES: hypothetical protein [unclassified Rhodanobacter]
MVIYTFLMAAIFVQTPSQYDCGYSLHESSIKKTAGLIIGKVNLKIPTTITEMPKKGGSKECARFEFNISTDGRAKNILLRENSRSYDMNVTALDALKRYKFHYQKEMENMRFTLIFHATLNVAPPCLESTSSCVDN